LLFVTSEELPGGRTTGECWCREVTRIDVSFRIWLDLISA
jgi:hypothetical protein